MVLDSAFDCRLRDCLIPCLITFAIMMVVVIIVHIVMYFKLATMAERRFGDRDFDIEVGN